MASSTPSDDRDARAEGEFGSRSDQVTFYPDGDPTGSPVRPSFLAELAATIESVVIPRLQLNHENGGPISMRAASSTIDSATISVFVEKLTKGESRDALRHVEALLERGIALDTILLDLLSPAARIMGEMWIEDSCNFVDVTLGMTRIQHVFRQLRAPFDLSVQPMQSKGRALLLPAPGEQHVFGLRVVEQFLLQDGWDVDCRLHASLNDMLSLLRDETYDIAGFSLSGERLLEPLASAIRLTRLNSRNREIRIMVGGVFFADHPEAGRDVGADAVTLDARSAVAKANEWHGSMRFAQ